MTSRELPVTRKVGNSGLHTILTTQETPRVIVVMSDVHALPLDCESDVIDTISWMPGKMNAVHALTKQNSGGINGMLEVILTIGRLPRPIDDQRGCGGKISVEN